MLIAFTFSAVSVLWSATLKDRFLPSAELRELREWKEERRKYADLHVGLITSERDEVRMAKIRNASMTNPMQIDFPGLENIPVVYLTNRVKAEADQTIRVDKGLEHVLIPTKSETNIALHFVLWNGSAIAAEDVELTANISTNLSFGSTMPPWYPTHPVVTGCMSIRTMVKETILPGTELILPELLFLLKPGNIDLPLLVSIRIRAKRFPTSYTTFYVVFTSDGNFASPARAVANSTASSSNYVLRILPPEPPKSAAK